MTSNWFFLSTLKYRYVYTASKSNIHFAVSLIFIAESPFGIVSVLVPLNPFTPNDHYSGRTAPLTSKRCILYIYSTNIGTEHFKNGIYSPLFPLQNAVCFMILTYLVPVLFRFYIQGVLSSMFSFGYFPGV